VPVGDQPAANFRRISIGLRHGSNAASA
jgi:hypothetical protein